MDSAGFLLGGLVLLIMIGVGFITLMRCRDARVMGAQKNPIEPPRLPSSVVGSPPPQRLTFSAFELPPQATYRVVAKFADYDKRVHEVGERWRFLRKAFLPYEDGLSLFVEQNGREMHIRMQCRDEEQGPIVSAFSDFVAEE